MLNIAVLLFLGTSAGFVVGYDFPVDVVFLVDASDSVGVSNFEIQKQFVIDVVNKWNIGPKHIMVGLVGYGDKVKNYFYLNQFQTKSGVTTAIKAAVDLGGHGHTADALNFVGISEFDPAHGSRPNVPKVAVIITDGDHSDHKRITTEAARLRARGIKLYLVAVSEKVDKDLLDSLSDSPHYHYTARAETYTTLTDLVDPIAIKIADEVPLSSTLLPPPTACLKVGDVAVMIDSSSSLIDVDFHHIENFLKALVIALNIGPNAVQLSLSQFSSFPQMMFPLNKYKDRLSMLNALGQVRHIGGSTHTAQAIDFARLSVFSSSEGSRPYTPHVLIIITDGKSDSPSHTVRAADEARKAGISVIAVGVGPAVDTQELFSIANDPDIDYTFSVGDFHHLVGTIPGLLNSICQVAPSTVVTPTAASLKVCADQQPDCDSYGVNVCTKSQSWAKSNCEAFCGFCDPFTTKGFNDSCYYKGKTYRSGESWNDGCDYTCMCKDASIGAYVCYNRCPVYHNLPAECTLAAVPSQCCLKPVCNFKPTITTTQGSNHRLNSMNVDVCVYKNREYYQNSYWQDRCDLKCTCVDASKGRFDCQDVCPKYPALPKQCRLEKTLGDCCFHPVCEFSSITGTVEGTGVVSGFAVVKPVSTCADSSPSCANYGSKLCTTYYNWAKDNCKKSCNLCGAPVNSQNAICLSEGRPFKQGDIWTTSCSTECVCEDADRGYSRCTKMCPKYTSLPAGCVETPGSGCCGDTVCTGGWYISSTLDPTNLANGGGITVKDSHGNNVNPTPTQQSGLPFRPGSGTTSMKATTIDGCLVDGNVYTQGQLLVQECKDFCVCDDEHAATYKCYPRCHAFEKLPSACQMVRDSQDACCLVPKCSGSLIGYTGVPKRKTRYIYSGPVSPPQTPHHNHKNITSLVTWIHSVKPPLNVSAPTGPPVGIGYCSRNKTRYLQGDTWFEGCAFQCACIDASIGHYECIERCPNFVVPKPYCKLVQDPTNPCCKIPKCDFSGTQDRFTGVGSLTKSPATTPEPPIGKCLYKKKHYVEGQIWNDGCGLTCQCIEALHNLYDCWSRCPDYNNLPKNCGTVPDPNDPTCCTIPACFNETFFTGHGPVPPTLPPGTYTGDKPKGPDGCYFGGKQYKQAETWQYGCQFKCKCEDSAAHLYRCTDLCPRYNKLAANCKLVPDVNNPCCSVPVCPTYVPVTGTAPPTLPPDASFCTYKEAQILVNSGFNDGCDLFCVCDDVADNRIRCKNRCTAYPPSTCPMKVDPNDPCCSRPVCGNPIHVDANTTGYINPDKLPKIPPGGTYTGTHVAPTGDPGFCKFGNHKYTQNAQFEDGCEGRCVCTDQTKGTYTCTKRCPEYAALPAACHLVPDPSDPCCKIPVCDIHRPNPPSKKIPGSCSYNGKSYTKGQWWYEGCDLKCICEDDVQNAVNCMDRCFKRTAAPLPTGCSVRSDPRDPLCCQTVVCDVPTNPSDGYVPNPPSGFVSGSFLAPSGVLHPTDECSYMGRTYKIDETWTVGCDKTCRCVDTGFFQCIEMCPVNPMAPAGCKTVPDPGNVCCERLYCNSTLTNTPVNKGCTYRKQIYPEGTSWASGCDEVCTCESKTTGFLRCEERCKTYRNVPAGCHEITDPNDACCRIPVCDPKTTNFTAITTVKVGTGGGPNPNPPNRGCTYNGNLQVVGSIWLDGCNNLCTCVDDHIPYGRYECEDRCPRYNTIPPTCQLVTSTSDPCCAEMKCDLPTKNVTSPPATCTYMGGSYLKGQTWFDGCASRCECSDPATNTVNCQQRCPYYDSIPAGCTLVADPNDPVCCKVPLCLPDFTVPSNNSASILPSVTATFDGIGRNPKGAGCMYKGKAYKEGDSWSDGCDYDCICVDKTKGKYRCRVMCPVYSSALPMQCSLRPDPNNKCCSQAVCDLTHLVPPTLTPGTGLCEFRGAHYRTGQTWAVGAESLCRCEDGGNNLVTCQDRCPSFDPTALAKFKCEWTVSAADPLCLVPACIDQVSLKIQGLTSLKYTRVLPRFGAVRAGVCLSEGNFHLQGNSWTTKDGSSCTCTDAKSGLFQCQDRCLAYPANQKNCVYGVDAKGCVTMTC